MLDSGTSMAAPVVSGALALVAQAYPWMTGKQLADVILTTANNDFEAPAYTVLYDTANLNPPEGKHGTVSLVLIAATQEQADTLKQKGTASIEGHELSLNVSALSDADFAFIKTLVQRHISQDQAAWMGGDPFVLDDLEAKSLKIAVLSKEEVFGRGILDVGKAVRGPALLDANRMTSNNVVRVPALNNRAFAIETFDTAGYVAEFSNDIAQRSWIDRYHHPEYRTSANGSYSFHARALSGKDVGLRKIGQGTLILSGNNTYAGATLVDEGVLVVAKRTDRTGGELQQSDVVVSKDGTLKGDGYIAQQVINDGLVAPGYEDPVLTVGSYTQSKNGTLLVTVGSDGTNTALKVEDEAHLAGNLSVSLAGGQFYHNNFAIEVQNFIQSDQITGAFDSYYGDWGEWYSPTLESHLLNTTQGSGDDYSGQVVVTRPQDAYARYALNSSAADLGFGLYDIASVATGDMQALLSALDWSAVDGHEIRAALNELGAETYNAVARASLAQHREFNQLILQHLLSAKKTEQSKDNNNSNNQVWGSAYGSETRQKSHEDVSAWESSGMGLVLGAERYLSDDLSVGAHLALTDRSIDISGEHAAQAETQSIFVGLHSLWAPAAWDGFWLTAQGRLGLENGDMDRTIAFNGYIRSPESHWKGIAGGALIGGGKDWSWEIGTNQGNGKGQAASLSVSDELYQSLALCLGAHVGWNSSFTSGESLNINLLAAWQHAALNTTLDTDAAFSGYDSYGFSTETALPRKDSMVLQSSVRITHPSSFFIQAELAGEFFRSDYTAVNLGLRLGFAF